MIKIILDDGQVFEFNNTNHFWSILQVAKSEIKRDENKNNSYLKELDGIITQIINL